ncbi:septum formation initiator family protein [Anaerococcus hydrogenalis]|uniref:Septum formation initiator n=3 Tax=Anaerococcus hydrogenalis TaxID=33029 RepID=F0H0W4_9FIRM|nr:septum formation initiator family protein [Anaerococcus hydrogenalis]EEB35463.1 septum formation initiator [Anaerococcus hydrogenalis DSM 7454]EGC83914.1 septum formation initiator [Anaerococcus hydrogenalis ACS-025-V-Sch4]MDK7695097.1 septum formation initiator family protein [Anaerococcus hydrogenalis]MDK7696928.1 septum formation initiator family protein [Anaerococcus hydrogenalis]MDK7708124.1 septum formation initiator family protein [Anaerococcus hydrogenalis]
MSAALKKRKVNKNLNKRKKLSLHNQTSYDTKFSYNRLKKKDKKFKRNVLALLILSFIFMGIFSLHNYMKLNNMRNEYNNLQSQYTSYQLTRDRLNKDLEDSVDLKEIQRYAMENLGMIYENKDNTVYLNIDR